jgi:hypothetical protein
MKFVFKAERLRNLISRTQYEGVEISQADARWLLTELDKSWKAATEAQRILYEASGDTTFRTIEEYCEVENGN